MSLLHRPGILNWLQGHLLCRVPEARDRFALTFDDGPGLRNTPRLLDILARHAARATFFVIASRVRRHHALVERALAEGHEIGVHGGLHVPPWSLPRAWLKRELTEAARAVADVTGVPPRHYRAPFGLLFEHRAAWVREWGLRPVLGDIHPRDHAVRRPALIAGRVLSRLDAGSIVILHDSGVLTDVDRYPTLAAVDVILQRAAERSLRSVPVAELVGAAAEGNGEATATPMSETDG